MTTAQQQTAITDQQTTSDRAIKIQLALHGNECYDPRWIDVPKGSSPEEIGVAFLDSLRAYQCEYFQSLTYVSCRFIGWTGFYFQEPQDVTQVATLAWILDTHPDLQASGDILISLQG